MSAVKRSRTTTWPRLSVGLVCLLAIAAAHASDNSNSTLDPCNLFDPVPGSQHGKTPVLGSNENDPSTVAQLLAECGSEPISFTPPPPISARSLGLSPPPPPQPLTPQEQERANQVALLSLQQQLVAQEEELGNLLAALAQAQSTLAIFQGQVAQFCSPFLGGNPNPSYSEDNCAEAQSFVATWTTAVQTDQNLVNLRQPLVNQLQAQITALSAQLQ